MILLARMKITLLIHKLFLNIFYFQNDFFGKNVYYTIKYHRTISTRVFDNFKILSLN